TALHDAAAARAIDRRATAALGGDGYVLMQRAGQAAWRALLELWPQATRIVVACGPGNNGGDGYVLARLARQSGRQVRLVHPAGGGPRSPLAQRACTDYLAAGGRVDLFPCALDEADVLVGLAPGAARDDAGALRRDTLGVAAASIAAAAPAARLLRAPALGGWLPPRPRDFHKGLAGRVLCIGGEHGHGGAIVLCAEAA